VTTFGGVVICFSGMTNTSFFVYKGTEITTYYLDKNQYDLYLNGLIYSLTFGISFLLFLAVILIPSPEQIKKRHASTQFAGAKDANFVEQEKVPSKSDENTLENEPLKEEEEEEEEGMEIELEPELENFDMSSEEDSKVPNESNNDSDVVYGTGSITDSSHRSFILSNPDSAVKFLLRKELDGRPLKSSQEEIYEDWQNRGLSRGKLRKHFLKIMEWESVPELEVVEIFNKLKDRVYEIKHSEEN